MESFAIFLVGTFFGAVPNERPELCETRDVGGYSVQVDPNCVDAHEVGSEWRYENVDGVRTKVRN